MPQLKRAIQLIFGKSRKPRPQVFRSPAFSDIAIPLPLASQVCEAIDAVDSTIAKSQSDGIAGELLQVAQSSIDTIANVAEKNAEEDCAEEPMDCEEEEGCEEDNDEEEDVPLAETFQSDLVQKTAIEMMIARVYVALSNDDCDIASLRTHDGQQFTHVVRLIVTSSGSNANIRPSRWSLEQSPISVDGPQELRLLCPDFTLRLDADQTALKWKQLLAARDYIAEALSSESAAEERDGVDLPFPGKNRQVLIVGSAGRVVDVLTIVVCYLSFLTGVNGGCLLKRLQETKLVRSPWRDQTLGEATCELADAVARSCKS